MRVLGLTVPMLPDQAVELAAKVGPWNGSQECQRYGVYPDAHEDPSILWLNMQIRMREHRLYYLPLMLTVSTDLKELREK